MNYFLGIKGRWNVTKNVYMMERVLYTHTQDNRTVHVKRYCVQENMILYVGVMILLTRMNVL